MLTPPTKGGTLEAPTKEGAAAIQASEDGNSTRLRHSELGPERRSSGQPQHHRHAVPVHARRRAHGRHQDLAIPHQQGRRLRTGQPGSDRTGCSRPISRSDWSSPKSGDAATRCEEPPLSPPFDRPAKRRKRRIYVRAQPADLPGRASGQVYEEATAKTALSRARLSWRWSRSQHSGRSRSGDAGRRRQRVHGRDAGLSITSFSSPSVPLTQRPGRRRAVRVELRRARSTRCSPSACCRAANRRTNLHLGGHVITRNAISSDGSQVVFTAARRRQSNPRCS